MSLSGKNLKQVAAELSVDEWLIAVICADEDNFLTGEIEISPNGSQVDDDAFEEIKEAIANIAASPGGIDAFLAGSTSASSAV